MGNTTTLRGPHVRSLCTLEASSRSMGPRVALGRRGATGAGRKGWRGVLVGPTSGRPRAARQEGLMRVSSRGGLVRAYTGPPVPSLTARAAHGATRSDYSYRKRRSQVVVEGERW